MVASDIVFNDGRVRVENPLSKAKKMFENGMHSIGYGKDKGITVEQVKQGLKTIEGMDMKIVTVNKSSQEILFEQRIANIKLLNKKYNLIDDRNLKKEALVSVLNTIVPENFGLITNGQLAADVLEMRTDLQIEKDRLPGELMEAMRNVQKIGEEYIRSNPSILNEVLPVIAVLVNNEKEKLASFSPLLHNRIMEKIRDLNSRKLNVK